MIKMMKSNTSEAATGGRCICGVCNGTNGQQDEKSVAKSRTAHIEEIRFDLGWDRMEDKIHVEVQL